MSGITFSSASARGGCTLSGHVRIWAGGPEAKPKTCDCGAVRYVEHRCICGDVHEREVVNDPITREWDTPQEDAAWKNL